MAWLEPPADLVEEEPPSEAPTSSKRRPPRLPGAKKTLPPMPVGSTVPPPGSVARKTMEVDMRWVELVDEPKKDTAEKPKRAPAKKPIPREE